VALVSRRGVALLGYLTPLVEVGEECLARSELAALSHLFLRQSNKYLVPSSEHTLSCSGSHDSLLFLLRVHVLAVDVGGC
jgi:hypothetical protein